RIEPAVGDELIRKGRIDFITMGRKLLADPELPRKLQEGRVNEIRPCVYCYTCISQIFVNRSVICAVNARTGREFETVITPAAEPKHVLVVGGGPAGMETARVARLRGHRVTLCEKSSRLGGTVFFSAASYPPNGELVRHLDNEMGRLGVSVRLGTEVGPDTIRQLAPDVVVAALGAHRGMPTVPGIDLPHVLSGDDIRAMITGEGGRGSGSALVDGLMRLGKWAGVLDRPDWMRALSRLWMPLGERVVMVGGGLVAIELAEFLAERGRQVTVLEEGPVFGAGLKLVRRWRNIADCKRLGVQFLPEATLVRIEPDSLVYRNAGAQERRIPADQVIVTSGAEANPAAVERLREAGVPLHAIGDCSGVGYIDGAIHAGFELAMQL
ncbi:MAG: FAD-dependent oxidoreductase, partial [Gammaproteobacteria bacterium]